ncbi:unnamed protein product [Pseudo-nitzschia multistriata]|uniref:Uncharacterized protein n=1 Tax=Pseudo-nitzschia multistriata TaxID=183589 RepID=A0A448YYM8_9STRA|nr:unnamed protein product [Pseudo-nitzschia multistriata]
MKPTPSLPAAWFAGLSILFGGHLSPANAWVCPAQGGTIRKNEGSLAIGKGRFGGGSALSYSSGFSDERGAGNSNSTSPVLERLRINGVSVSPKGFHVLLEPTTARKTGTEHAGATDPACGEGEGKPSPIELGQPPKRQIVPGASDAAIAPGASDGETQRESAENGAGGLLLPLKVTNDPADAFAATSPESLTLCQLLSGVDMAGAILPPELLGKIVVSHVEDKVDSMYDDDDDDEEEEEQDNAAVFVPVLSPIEGKLWEFLKNEEALSREQQASASLYASSPVPPRIPQLPEVTLDQLTLVPAHHREGKAAGGSHPSWLCRLECALPQWKDFLTVDVRADLLASLAYNYDPESSPLFTCIALALRYKAPIVLEEELRQDAPSGGGHAGKETETKGEAKAKKAPTETEGGSGKSNSNSSSTNTNTHNGGYWSSPDDLDRDFPQRTTLRSLRQQSSRVTQNIERGFEIHKLTGALEIARRLGDDAAAEKIRAKLDEYDSMEGLPTLGDASGGRTTGGDDRLDDLEQNILQ